MNVLSQIALACMNAAARPEDLRFALNYLEVFSDLLPEPEDLAASGATPFRGAVQYRMKLYEEALESLTTPFPTWESHRVRLFFLAMTYHRLGRGEDARAALEEGRRALNLGFPGPPSIQAALPALVAEAEALLQGD